MFMQIIMQLSNQTCCWLPITSSTTGFSCSDTSWFKLHNELHECLITWLINYELLLYGIRWVKTLQNKFNLCVPVEKLHRVLKPYWVNHQYGECRWVFSQTGSCWDNENIALCWTQKALPCFYLFFSLDAKTGVLSGVLLFWRHVCVDAKERQRD